MKRMLIIFFLIPILIGLSGCHIAEICIIKVNVDKNISVEALNEKK